VRLRPGYADARNYSAVYHAQSGRLKQVFEKLEIAARPNPDFTAIRDNLRKSKPDRSRELLPPTPRISPPMRLLFAGGSRLGLRRLLRGDELLLPAVRVVGFALFLRSFLVGVFR
jgi:hypothetical protein